MRYAFVTATGVSCCKSDNIDHLCEQCRAAAKAYEAPDGYAPAIAVLRAASAPTFEDRYKAERMTALGAEHTRFEKEPR